MSPFGRNILVVEGNERTRAVIAETLAGEGFAVTGAVDGSTALAAVERTDFALAVVAVSLPGAIDGIAASRLARARRPSLKCLFVARAPPGAVWDNPEADDFIARPFDRRELLGCVFELLQRGAPRVPSAAADRPATSGEGTRPLPPRGVAQGPQSR